MGIRVYREGDEDEIARILNECFESFKSFGLTGDSWLRTFEYDPGYHKELAFVAEQDGRIVSHVQLVERELKVGAGSTLRIAGVANVATLKDYRRSGISTRLLTRALDVARKKGFMLQHYSLASMFLLAEYTLDLAFLMYTIHYFCSETSSPF
jgi:predicted N-acetyltransferase YhbS